MTSRSAARTKSLPDDVNAAGRVALRALIDARWGGKEAPAARDLGVSKVTLNLYLRGEKGGGARLAAAVMRFDASVGLVMMGADVPELRSAPWVPDVAARLRKNAPDDAVAWAVIQALHLGCGHTPDGLEDAAQALLAIRLAIRRPKN